MIDEKERSLIIETLQTQVSPKRLAHILGVEQKAIALATQYDVDVTACQYAALFHDYAKEWTREQYVEAVEKYHLDKSLLEYGSEILHGPVAACVCAHWFNDDKRIKDAIYSHATGDTVMNDVAKVLYVADYIEDGRVFKGVDVARELAKQVSLEATIFYKLQQTIIFLAKKGVIIHPKTIMAYNYWNSEKENTFGRK